MSDNVQAGYIRREAIATATLAKMKQEYACIHLWVQMPDFSLKPCEKCGAIRDHIQMLDDLEDAAKEFAKAKGLVLNDAREDLINARAEILLRLRKER